MPLSFQVLQCDHRAFGRLIRLSLDGDTRLDFTPEEAATVSRALTAVREGRSMEREIYMSPIASDHEFSGAVLTEGVRVTIAGRVAELGWAEVERLALDLIGARP
jgi:hypothetical protein